MLPNPRCWDHSEGLMSYYRAVAAAVALPTIVAVAAAASMPAQPALQPAPRPAFGIHKLKHVIVIMQENRSFDSYFGTYPGADGIPNGVCVPDPLHGGCIKPYVDHADRNSGGSHVNASSIADVNGGEMNGFVKVAESKCKVGKPCKTDVMGHHVASDIPDYWAYARHFALDDHLFESDDSWSLPAHMYDVSAWSADCSNPANPMTCFGTDMPSNRTSARPRPFAWTDLTWLLHKHQVRWGYYLD